MNSLGANHPKVADDLDLYADLLEELDRFDSSPKYRQRAKEIRSQYQSKIK